MGHPYSHLPWNSSPESGPCESGWGDRGGREGPLKYCHCGKGLTFCSVKPPAPWTWNHIDGTPFTEACVADAAHAAAKGRGDE